MNEKPDFQEMREELQEIAKPLVDYLYKYGSPHSKIIVEMDDAEMVSGDCVCQFEARD